MISVAVECMQLFKLGKNRRQVDEKSNCKIATYRRQTRNMQSEKQSDYCHRETCKDRGLTVKRLKKLKSRISESIQVSSANKESQTALANPVIYEIYMPTCNTSREASEK